MCEMLLVKSPEAIPIQWVMSYASLLDEYGLGGFGWGVAWKSEEGNILSYRSVNGIRKDETAAASLNGVRSKEFFVHMRRPSLMSTIAVRNVQPYVTVDQSLAFAHNGNFLNHDSYRPSFVDLLKGTSDSEVGYQLFLKQLAQTSNPLIALQETYNALQGKANVVVFRKEAETVFYAGNEDNFLYSFQLDGISCLSTSLHSLDQFVFETIYPSATAIRQIPLFSAEVFH